MNSIHCYVGYIKVKDSNETISNIVRNNENIQEYNNKRLMDKVNEIRDEIDQISQHLALLIESLTSRAEEEIEIGI